MALDFAEYADEIGPGLIILVALVLIVFPEPATSTLGVGLLLFGLVYLFYEWQRP
ncbi:hypothetical protein [Halegenticoccus tardaugens]|uniref:hypothetical protein n=1 Tax=Halegenticoccus tardaugens TaxID=2071624 RepID=UPI0013E9948C|nr:hypothetical protein [Halegenticoccus tardaugens]